MIRDKQLAAFTIRVWCGQNDLDYRVCIKWDIDLSGLAFIGNKVRITIQYLIKWFIVKYCSHCINALHKYTFND